MPPWTPALDAMIGPPRPSSSGWWSAAPRRGQSDRLAAVRAIVGRPWDHELVHQALVARGLDPDG